MTHINFMFLLVIAVNFHGGVNRSMLLLMEYARSFLQRDGHSLFFITGVSVEEKWMNGLIGH